MEPAKEAAGRLCRLGADPATVARTGTTVPTVAPWVLVHSPLVGPVTWRGVAAALDKRGQAAIVPELTPPLDTPHPWWSHAAADVVSAVRTAGLTRSVLAGHSGAGPGLPAVGAELAAHGVRVAGYVFVDAGLPTPGRSARETLPSELRERLEGLVDADGVLPPWCDWWGDGALMGLVPEPVVRRRLESECWPVPASLFDEVPPVPSGWPEAPCAYLCSTYVAEALEAEGRGWPVRRREGGSHLDVLGAPDDIADALVALAAAAGIDAG